MGEPDSVRQGWLDALKYAADLERLTPILCAAAELCGVSTAHDTMLLPLLIDASGCHRRRTWEAWRADGARTGRWGALAVLDARIRACGLDDLAPYREPKPLIRKQFPVGGEDSRGIYKTTIIDPEDEDFAPEEPKRRRALARYTARASPQPWCDSADPPGPGLGAAGRFGVARGVDSSMGGRAASDPYLASNTSSRKAWRC